jgi:hypothetical protein
MRHEATVKTEQSPTIHDALNHVRTAAQELHGAISDAAAKQGGATKADLEAFAQKARTVAESAKDSAKAEHEAVKKHLTDAVGKLESTQKHIVEGLKASGQSVQTSVNKAVGDVRASVQKISEAVAAKRAARSNKK